MSGFILTFATSEPIKQRDMKSKHSNLILFLAMLFCFAGCEVEFDPNEEWKQVTVIYGVLDQDSDTTFVRVQKGFLGSGNYIDFAKEKDSVYYKQNEIDVFMLSYYPWDKNNAGDTLWFDYTETTTKQDGDFYNETTPLYRCCTKETGTLEKYKKEVYNRLSYLSYAPIIFISAKTGQRVDKLFTLIQKVATNNARRIPTAMLNQVINEAIAVVQPPTDKGRRLKILYGTQVQTKPPTFVIFVNNKELFHFSYERYLVNQIRKEFGLEGTPIRIIVREKLDKDMM